MSKAALSLGGKMSETGDMIALCRRVAETIRTIEINERVPLDFRLALLQYLRGEAQGSINRIGARMDRMKAKEEGNE